VNQRGGVSSGWETGDLAMPTTIIVIEDEKETEFPTSDSERAYEALLDWLDESEANRLAFEMMAEDIYS
jgi:hypothetical protein